jgi:DNA (cytosine-5)-methyltransferase 1
MSYRARKSKPKVVDLFAGAGLFSHAFVKEGFHLVYAVELDRAAATTLRLNHQIEVNVADVRRVDPIPGADVIIAGPPCQGFSSLGNRNPEDPRNLLSLEVLRWARVTRPTVIVIENVVAFLDTPIWTKLKKGLQRLGYSVTPFALNAHDFAVPQLRTRSFTIASKRGTPVIRIPSRKGNQTVRKAWQGLPSVPDGRNHHYAPSPSPLALARMRVLGRGGDKRDIIEKAAQLAAPSWKHVSQEATDVWGRMEWDKPSNTLRTCFQNPSKGRYIHPEQHRVISLREAARLHSIEDGWAFAGSPTQIARQIGNSVPPLLGRAVARAVIQLL